MFDLNKVKVCAKKMKDYFDSIESAVSYDCVTASPEINNRILQMKLRSVEDI